MSLYCGLPLFLWKQIFWMAFNSTGWSISGLTTYILKRIAAEISPRFPAFSANRLCTLTWIPAPSRWAFIRAIGCFSVAVINTVDQKQLGEEGFVMGGSQGRNCSRDHWPRVALLPAGWALPQQSLMKEILGSHARKLIWWGWFLIWGFLFPDDSSLCHVDRLRNTEAGFTHRFMK